VLSGIIGAVKKLSVKQIDRRMTFPGKIYGGASFVIIFNVDVPHEHPIG
jgi:hypothetical protein